MQSRMNVVRYAVGKACLAAILAVISCMIMRSGGIYPVHCSDPACRDAIRDVNCPCIVNRRHRSGAM